MHQEEIARLLPQIFQSKIDWHNPQDILRSLLTVMEQQHAPTIHTLNELHTFFHPDTTPPHFLSFLAYWVGLAPIIPPPGKPFPTGNNCYRNLILAAIEIAQIRGTRRGLLTFLQTATGISGFNIIESEEILFHMTITYPAAATPYLELIHQIIKLEKPAYMTYQLQLYA